MLKSPLLKAYEEMETERSLSFQPQTPLATSPTPNYPLCTLGLLTAEGGWGTQKGIAFVIEDNYLLTCASNCYSHQHGQFPNIIFTISKDIYKIAKVFIPEQYKANMYQKYSLQNMQQINQKHNYALLFVEGQLNLKDKYGAIGLQCYRHKLSEFTSINCIINCNNQLKFDEQCNLVGKSHIDLSGSPILKKVIVWNSYSVASGLSVYKCKNSRSYCSYVRFGIGMKYQLDVWTRKQSSSFRLNSLKKEDLNAQCLIGLPRKAVKRLGLRMCQLSEESHYSFFQQLPLSSVCNIRITNNKYPLSLAFIKQQKFTNLKEIMLHNNNIQPLGCKIIAEANLPNLRLLDLSHNPISSEGCTYLSTGKWHFLRKLELQNCLIGDEGIVSFCQSDWPSLNQLDISSNTIEILRERYCFIQQNTKNHQSQSFDALRKKVLKGGQITWRGLSFLKYAPWNSLRLLNLRDNFIGNKGCKIIKQSGIILQDINISKCRFGDVGLRWLCKADLSELVSLKMINNNIGNNGYYYLFKANVPKLQAIFLHIKSVGRKGRKCLFSNGWPNKSASIALSIFKFYDDFERVYKLDKVNIMLQPER